MNRVGNVISGADKAPGRGSLQAYSSKEPRLLLGTEGSAIGGRDDVHGMHGGYIEHHKLMLRACM